MREWPSLNLWTTPGSLWARIHYLISILYHNYICLSVSSNQCLFVFFFFCSAAVHGGSLHSASHHPGSDWRQRYVGGCEGRRTATLALSGHMLLLQPVGTGCNRLLKPQVLWLCCEELHEWCRCQIIWTFRLLHPSFCRTKPNVLHPYRAFSSNFKLQGEIWKLLQRHYIFTIILAVWIMRVFLFKMNAASL